MNRHAITPGSVRHSTLGFRNSPRLAPQGMAGFAMANPPFNVNAVDMERLKDIVGPGRRFPFGLPRTDNRSGSCMRDAYSNLWFNPDFAANRRAATLIKLASDRRADRISAT